MRKKSIARLLPRPTSCASFEHQSLYRGGGRVNLAGYPCRLSSAPSHFAIYMKHNQIRVVLEKCAVNIACPETLHSLPANARNLSAGLSKAGAVAPITPHRVPPSLHDVTARAASGGICLRQPNLNWGDGVSEQPLVEYVSCAVAVDDSQMHDALQLPSLALEPVGACHGCRARGRQPAPTASPS